MSTTSKCVRFVWPILHICFCRGKTVQLNERNDSTASSKTRTNNNNNNNRVRECFRVGTCILGMKRWLSLQWIRNCEKR